MDEASQNGFPAPRLKMILPWTAYVQPPRLHSLPECGLARFGEYRPEAGAKSDGGCGVNKSSVWLQDKVAPGSSTFENLKPVAEASPPPVFAFKRAPVPADETL